MSPTPRRRMSGADALWLGADRAHHLMVIDAVMWTRRPVDRDRFRSVVQERLVDVYPVFSQRPVEPALPWALPAWEDDPDFALDRHLHHVRLDHPGGEQQLRQLMERQAAVPLDRSRPLWQAWIIDGYGEGSAVYCRLHHSLADGIALARVMLTLTDPASGVGDVGTAPPARDGLLDTLRTGAELVVGGARSLPWLPRTTVRTARVARKLLVDRLPETLLSAEPGTAKRLAWSRAIPLGAVKAVGRATGTTVNDVLVAALSGALARFLAEHDQEVDHLTTMVPVNLRRPDQPLPRELGNRFALVMLPLPTGRLGVRERLRVVHRRMESIKHSPEAVITSLLAEGIGRLHRIEGPFVDFFAGKAIGVTTNVVGPREPRYLAGVEVDGVLGWVPGSGGQTLGVAIFSYAGAVRIGFKVDAATVPCPDRLVELFEDELDALRALAPGGTSMAGG